MKFVKRIKEYLARIKRERYIKKIAKQTLDSIASSKEHLELNIKLTHKELKEEDDNESE
jgi:hypothetical protein